MTTLILGAYIWFGLGGLFAAYAFLGVSLHPDLLEELNDDLRGTGFCLTPTALAAILLVAGPLVLAGIVADLWKKP